MASDTEAARAGSRHLQGARKVIAAHMMESLATSAQLSFHGDFDITSLLSSRIKWKAEGRRAGIEDCLIAAMAETMEAHARFNGVVTGDRLSLCETVDVSVAISVNGLLLTPVIRHANRLSVDEIADRRRDLVDRARGGTLKTSEMLGGTATVSNLGRSSVRYFTPILNKGQLIILGVGCINEHLVRTPEGPIATQQTIGLSLTVDHRFIDGEPAARLLGDVGERLSAIASRN